MCEIIARRGRPPGSKTSGADARTGRVPPSFALPSLAEKLRMRVLEVLASRMPIAFRLLDDEAMEKLEDDLERMITAVLNDQ